MGTLSELTVGEIGRGLARYRPAALTVGAILLALVVLPKPERALVDLAGQNPGSTSATVVAGAEGVAPATPETTPDFSTDSSGSTDFSSPTTGFSPSGSSFDDDDFSSSPTTTFPESDFTFAPTTGSDQPLRVVAKAWASRTAGTPLAANGVPAGTLPVGSRAGQDDKLSFVRLSGDEKVLRLPEDAAGGRTVPGPVAVQACQITDAGWKEGEAIAIEDAPNYERTKCVPGIRSAEGLWSFDLSSFASPADERGFALTPGSGAGVDFQVAFKPS